MKNRAESDWILAVAVALVSGSTAAAPADCLAYRDNPHVAACANQYGQAIPSARSRSPVTPRSPSPKSVRAVADSELKSVPVVVAVKAAVPAPAHRAGNADVHRRSPGADEHRHRGRGRRLTAHPPGARRLALGLDAAEGLPVVREQDQPHRADVPALLPRSLTARAASRPGAIISASARHARGRDVRRVRRTTCPPDSPCLLRRAIASRRSTCMRTCSRCAARSTIPTPTASGSRCPPGFPAAI